MSKVEFHVRPGPLSEWTVTSSDPTIPTTRCETMELAIAFVGRVAGPNDTIVYHGKADVAPATKGEDAGGATSAEKGA